MTRLRAFRARRAEVRRREVAEAAAVFLAGSAGVCSSACCRGQVAA